ncbi:MAG: hypothetical protein AB7V04_05655 [Desulfomonilaceae bacterium]
MIRSVFVLIASMSILLVTGPGQVFSDSGMALNVCQELVNNARAYESRATWHNRVCKNLMKQIENMSQGPKNPGTAQALETLFQQYDQNREMENKLRQLFRQTSEEAERCMKAIN